MFQGTETHLQASLRSLAFFNARTLGFYPGVDPGDKEDRLLSDEQVMDGYEWDSWDDDPYENVRPHLMKTSSDSCPAGVQDHTPMNISVTPVVINKLAAASASSGSGAFSFSATDTSTAASSTGSTGPTPSFSFSAKPAETSVPAPAIGASFSFSQAAPTTKPETLLHSTLGGSSSSAPTFGVSSGAPAVTKAATFEAGQDTVQEQISSDLKDIKEQVSYQVDPEKCEVLFTFDLGSLAIIQDTVEQPLNIQVSSQYQHLEYVKKKVGEEQLHSSPKEPDNVETQGHDVTIPIPEDDQTNLAASSHLVPANSVSEMAPGLASFISTPSIATTSSHCSVPVPNCQALPMTSLPPLLQINNQSSNTSIPEADLTEVKTRPGVELDVKITSQEDIVRKLKTENADKADIDATVKTLFGLKANYKAETGSYWKPAAVPGSRDKEENKSPPPAGGAEKKSDKQKEKEAKKAEKVAKKGQRPEEKEDRPDVSARKYGMQEMNQSKSNLATMSRHCFAPTLNCQAHNMTSLSSLQQISSSMSQGKLRVINHGIQSENIQSSDPSLLMLSNDARQVDSIIDCENLLEQFEGSLAADSNDKEKNPVLQSSTKNLLDFLTLCGHPLVISQNDLDSLSGTNFVTEGAVEFYLDMLHRKMDIRAQKDVHILSTAIFPTLKLRFEKGNERLLHISENIFDKNLVILPICHNHHWIIAVASRFIHA